MKPVRMSLRCEKCGLQHVDVLDEATGIDWSARPHKTHLCLGCGHLFRPFEYATLGVATTEQEARPWLEIAFAWYDFWVGAYWDRKNRTLYVCPLPMLLITWRPR